MADLVHPALKIVEKTMAIWDREPAVRGSRAMLIVQRLIEMGYLAGTMRADVPLAPDDPAPKGNPRE
jgi:hypothetical protein